MKYCVAVALCFAGLAHGDIVELSAISQVSYIDVPSFPASDSVATTGPKSEVSFSITIDTSVPGFGDDMNMTYRGDSVVGWTAKFGANTLSGDSARISIGLAAATQANRNSFVVGIFEDDIDTYDGDLSTFTGNGGFNIIYFTWNPESNDWSSDISEALSLVGDTSLDNSQGRIQDVLSSGLRVEAEGLETTVVPAPASLAFLCFAGGFGYRRRR